MSIFYPPKLGLYDNATNRPIYFANTETESGIYDSTERGRYLIIRINYTNAQLAVDNDAFGLDPDPDKVYPVIGRFAGYGYGVDNGHINSVGFIVGAGGVMSNKHLTNKTLNLDKWMAAPINRTSGFYFYGGNYIGDYFFSGPIDIGKLRSFGYGASVDGLYVEIVIRAGMTCWPNTEYVSRITPFVIVVDGWVGEVSDYNAVIGGTRSRSIQPPILVNHLYSSPNVPESAAYVCTLRYYIPDGSITYSY